MLIEHEQGEFTETGTLGPASVNSHISLKEGEIWGTRFIKRWAWSFRARSVTRAQRRLTLIEHEQGELTAVRGQEISPGSFLLERHPLHQAPLSLEIA
jgi:hypothetical protein